MATTLPLASDNAPLPWPVVSTEYSPTLPTYDGACTANVVPELVKQLVGRPIADWMPSAITEAEQIVLLVLDGLGWLQFEEKRHLAPTLGGFDGGPITAVAPTTTATGLTSIVTGRTPAVHGVVGYRLAVEDDVLNILKWTTSKGDARESIRPTDFQVHPAFAANEVPVVIRNHFVGSGFSSMHLQGVRYVPYAVPSSLPVEVWRLAKAGEKLIYAYYGGIDAVAHQNGLGEHYDAELYTVERMIRDLVAGLPEGTALVITSDHGQVQVGGRHLRLDDDVRALTARGSGEGRFRWLHANDDPAALRDLCKERYSDLAWVVTRDEMSEQGWFGGPIDERVAARLGDVALVASAAVAFRDPDHDGENQMQCRHGSMTEAEVMVPLLAHRV